MVADIITNFDAIYQGNGRALILAKRTPTRVQAYIQLEPSEAGDFYDVKTATPSRKKQFAAKEPLWERAVQSTPPAEAGSVNHSDQSGETSLGKDGGDLKQSARGSYTPASNTMSQGLREDAEGGDMPFELWQAIRAGVDLDQRVEVINVAPFTVPGRPGTLGDALAKTIDTSPIINKNTGWKIALSRRKLNDIAGKIGKSVDHRDHVAALNAIRDIMEGATYVDDHPDGENRPGIKRVHRFFSAINVDGRRYAVKTTVLEYDDGRKDASIAAMRKLHEQRLEKKIPAGPSIEGETAGASSAEERSENQSHASQGEPTQSSDTTPLEHTKAILTLREILSGVEDTYRGGTYAQSARGSYTPATNTIRLFQSANMSTFVHESGHQWLFQMADDLGDARLLPEARAQIVADLGAVLGHLGVKGVDPTTATPQQIKAALSVEQHETFARSVEAYLREGKAPSKELRSAFRRLSSWLVQIYRSLRGLNVEMTAEIRGVMDRLLGV